MKKICFYFCEKMDGKIDLIAFIIVIFLKFLKINRGFNNISNSEIK